MSNFNESAAAPNGSNQNQYRGPRKQTPYSYQEQNTDNVLPQIDIAHIPQITDELARIPERLRQRIWCCFKIEPRADGRVAKIPYSPSGYPLSGKVGSPEHRSRLVTCEEALRAWKRQPDRFAGVGFFTDKGIGIILADFDSCYDAPGRLKPYIKMVLSYLRSYTEESFSGKGKHCLFFGKMPEGGSVYKEDGIELYDTHFVVWTGQMDDHYPAELYERQEELEALHQDLIYRRELRKNKRAESSTEVTKVSPSPSAPPILLPDDEIIRRAERMRGEAGEIFRRLHKHGDITGFPHEDGRPDPSRADYNYFRLIAFWCHRDPLQMERIGRKSALYRPNRWNDGDYLQKTIEAAIKDCTEVYTGTVKNRTGGGGRDATFVELDGRVMAHTELSTNRRLAFRAIIQEYQENLHLMDKQGYVPVCYRLMAMKYHLSEQALSDAGVDAKKYGLLEKRTKQGKDFKTELRIKPTPGFAIGDFPKLEKTKRPGGKRYTCPSCSLEEATIKKKTSIVFICRNPDCERCDSEQEMYSEEKQRRQKRSKKAQKQETKQPYSCTLSPEEEEKSSASQVDVSEHEEVCRGEYEDAQVSQVDVLGSDESRQMECEEQQEELEILPFLYTDSQVDEPMDDEFPFQEEDHEQDAPIVEINTTHPPITCDIHVSQVDVSRDSIEPVSQEYSAGKRRPITPKDIQDINGLQNFVGKLESSGLPMGVKACSICGSVIWNSRTRLCARGHPMSQTP